MFEITNAPPPAPPEPKQRTDGSVYPFHELNETQSFFISAEFKDRFKNIRSAASYYAKKHRIWLRCYTLDDGRLQVYRDVHNAGPVPKDNNSHFLKLQPPTKPPAGLIPSVENIPAPPPPIGLPPIPGPTQEQWNTMLERMPITDMSSFPLCGLTIDPEYQVYFKQMQLWTAEFAHNHLRQYSALVVGNSLKILRGEDLFIPEFSDVSTDTIENEADNANIEVIAESLPPVSRANDGWTGRVCSGCNGKGCDECGNTGEEYIAELDLRTESVEQVQTFSSPVVQPQSPSNLASIAAYIEREARLGIVKDDHGNVISPKQEQYDTR